MENTKPDVIKTETFMGISLRVIIKNNEKMIPLNDIAEGIGYDRSTLRKLFKRNERLLAKFSGKVIMPSPGGMQENICLNRDGANGLLMKLDLERIKDISKQNQILEFQDWAIKTLGKAMDNKVSEIKPFVNPQTQKSIGLLVSDQLQIADAMVKYANVDRGIATSMALTKVEYETGADLKMWKNILPKEKVNKHIGLLTPTEIGRELNLGYNAGASVNTILSKLGYIDRVGDHWRLTERGERYAEAYPVTGIAESGKSYCRYQIKWQPEIVNILHNKLFGEYPSTKNGLINGYI